MSSDDTAAANLVLLALNDKLVAKRMRTVDLFRKIDESGDGVVSPDEFLDGLQAFGFEPSKNEFHQLMKILDKDGDGEVDFREFDKAIKKAVKQESKESRSKRLAADLALEPTEGAVSDSYLANLMEKAQKTSHFFRGFTKNEVKSLLKVSQGTIQYSNQQTILPPNIQVKWLGLVLKGTVEVRSSENEDAILGRFNAGSLVRCQQFMDEYHAMSLGKSSKPSSGVLKLNPDRKESHPPIRMGTSVISQPPGSQVEYMVGASADGILLCWSYASLDILSQSESTKNVAYKFLQKLAHAQSSNYLERIHQTIARERAAAADVSGSKEAAKVAKMNKKMEEMELQREKAEAMIKKAKEAVHKAKNDEVLRKGLERKLVDATEKLKKAKKKIINLGGVLEDAENDGENKGKGKGKKGKKPVDAKTVVVENKKLKKALAEQKANSKRKLESLRKMLTAENKKKQKANDKNMEKKVDKKVKNIKEKLSAKHEKAMKELMDKYLKMEIELNQFKKRQGEEKEQKEQEAAKEKEEKAGKTTTKKKLGGWGKIRKKHKEESNKKREQREKFKELMQAASRQNLKSIRDQALAQLEATRQMLLKEQDEKKNYEDMLADAETLKQQMSNQVNDLMGLVGKAQAETSDIASKLKVKAHSDVKNKWKLAGAQFKDEKVKKTIAKLQAQAEIDSNERDELKKKLIDERYLNSEMRNEMIGLNETIDEKKDTIEEMKETISHFQKEKKTHLLSIQQLTDTSENRRIFAVLLTLRLGVEQRRLYFALESMTLHRNQLQDELDQTKEQLANAHRAIILHVKSNEELQAQITPLKQWCKKSHSHRKKLEELIVRFEIEMSAARDAIWSQAIKNKEMQTSLTKLSSDQINASEIRAKMLHRLKISEARRIELETRFSTLARASTPLMNQIRAVEQHSDLLLTEHEEESEFDGDGSSLGSNSIIDDDSEERSDWGENEDKWQSPYLKRKGYGTKNQEKNEMDLTANARRQQQTLITLEERELLDPSLNQLLFIGANHNTNVMAVMLLEQKGYSVQTIPDLKELRALSKEQGADELAYGIDLVLIDLNALHLSVDYVMRILGSNEMLGEQMSSRDIPVVALSTHATQRNECSKQPGMYFVLKPPKPGPFDLVVRSALARYHNLQMARNKKMASKEWSPTPDCQTDGLHVGLLRDENVEVMYANPAIQRPSPLCLPFPETPTPTFDKRRKEMERNSSMNQRFAVGGRERRERNNWSRSSADARPYNQQQYQLDQQKSPYPPSTPKRSHGSKTSSRRNIRSSGSSRLRLSALTDAEKLQVELQLIST